LAAIGVQLMAVGFRAGRGGWECFDGHGHQAEAEQAGPTGAAAVSGSGGAVSQRRSRANRVE